MPSRGTRPVREAGWVLAEGGAPAAKRRRKNTTAPRLRSSAFAFVARGGKGKKRDEGPCILAGGEGEKNTAPRLRSSAFALVARGGKSEEEMRGLASLRGEKKKKEKKLQHPDFARPLLLFPVQEKEKKRDEWPCILAGGKERANFSTPGFARLPLHLLPEGEGAK